MKKIDIEPKRMFCPQPMYVVGTYNEDNHPNFCVITRIGFAWDESPNVMVSRLLWLYTWLGWNKR